jgi:hypothetical protein
LRLPRVAASLPAWRLVERRLFARFRAAPCRTVFDALLIKRVLMLDSGADGWWPWGLAAGASFVTL